MAGNFLVRSRHGTVYYFRRRVPLHLQSIIGRKVLVQSLQTSDRRSAIIRSRAVAVHTDSIFQKIMARRKADSSDNTFEFKFEIPLDEITGRPKAIKVEAEPNEVEALNAAIKTSLEALGQNFGAVNAAPVAGPAQATVPQRTATFSDAIAEYFAKSQIKPQSKATHRAKLENAKAFFSDSVNVLQVDQVAFVRYCEHVTSTVANVTTQQLYIATVATFLNWHRIRAGLPQLTTKSLMPKKDTPDSDDRAPYTLAQLRVVLENAAGYRRSAPCKFWVSVAPVFLGCRIEELAQVHLGTDLQHDDKLDIWYFDFNGNPDPDGALRKSIKKRASWRRVPIHDTLVQHGFIDFLKRQHRAGFTRPFQAEWNPRESNNEGIGKICKWSQYISKWGGRELAKLGEQRQLNVEKLGYFHSMRHSFKQVLGNAGVSSEISEALSGRQYGGADAERYEHLKADHARLYRDGIQPGLGALATVLDEVLRPS